MKIFLVVFEKTEANCRLIEAKTKVDGGVRGALVMRGDLAEGEGAKLPCLRGASREAVSARPGKSLAGSAMRWHEVPKGKSAADTEVEVTEMPRDGAEVSPKPSQPQSINKVWLHCKAICQYKTI